MIVGVSGVGCYCGIASNLKSTQKLYTILQKLADDGKINFEYGIFKLKRFRLLQV